MIRPLIRIIRPRRLASNAFLAFDRLGVHVLPKDYYSPVADQGWLSRNRSLWARRTPLTGIEWDLDDQLSWLGAIGHDHRAEVAGLGSYREITESGVGPGYGPIESQVLHCFVRALRPRRIVEVGSGVSTNVILKALERNAAEGDPPCQVTCVEPFPNKMFQKLEGLTLVRTPCQAASPSVFAALGPGDLLFIDSSHALKTGSDLNTIYFDIIPRLRPGVFVHIHDIYLPYLYGPDTLRYYFGWQETALVLALLANNERLRVLACLSALHHDRPRELAALLPDYRSATLVDGLAPTGGLEGHFPTSLWLRTAGPGGQN